MTTLLIAINIDDEDGCFHEELKIGAFSFSEITLTRTKGDTLTGWVGDITEHSHIPRHHTCNARLKK